MGCDQNGAPIFFYYHEYIDKQDILIQNMVLKDRRGKITKIIVKEGVLPGGNFAKAWNSVFDKNIRWDKKI